MSKATPELIKELRERTGVGLAKCKSALEESAGDIEKAIELLRKAGIASAVKKETRVTNEGRIEFVDHPDVLVLLELNAETDFVVNNERFKELHKVLVNQAAKERPLSLDAFLAMPSKEDPSKSIDEKRKELISVIGENINISRLLVITKEKDASYGVYSHMGGKIVTVVTLKGASGQDAFAKEIAMHVAAEAPDYLSPSDVPQEVVAKEEEIAQSQVPAGRPKEIAEKIVQGKVRAFYDQFCLLNQKYIKDNTMSVGELVAAKAKEVGKPISLTQFIAWRVGG